MKKNFYFVLFLLIFGASSNLFAQYDNNWAIGFRAGEPLGINVRKYFDGGNKAFDANVGTYGFIYGRQRKYNKGYYKTAGLMVQGIYSWHTTVLNRDWFHVYYGFGGQINSRNHYPNSRIGQLDDTERKISLGPTGAAGIEIKIPNQDLAFFLDGGAYLEALPAPFFYNWQVSGGVRLNLIRP